jgi:tetratricopeptide (TPR) repeat protein
MRKLALAVIALLLFGLLVYQLPQVHNRLDWRLDFALTYLRGVVSPVQALPSALPNPQVRVTRNAPSTPSLTPAPTLSPTPGPTPTATLPPTPIPQAVALTPPEYEKQDINNCGPASLSMYLRYFGWEGDQLAIAELLKPFREDRNVNVEELVWFVRNRAGWLNVEFRVGGDLETLEKLIAAGLPVIIEESFYFEENYWPNDDHWAAHYLLLTGYDEAAGVFTAQDSYYGPDKKISHEALRKNWQSFNYVYLMVYPPEKEAAVKSILGSHWDRDFNRRHALEVAQAETEGDPENAFAWFNLGSNLVYFERYIEATQAYDNARNLGLPQRMLRYQFGPFMAYFHTGKLKDLFALTDYALQRTKNSEEALLWKGWGLYRQGDTPAALESFSQALQANPSYQDAQYALDFVRSNP